MHTEGTWDLGRCEHRAALSPVPKGSFQSCWASPTLGLGRGSRAREKDPAWSLGGRRQAAPGPGPRALGLPAVVFHLGSYRHVGAAALVALAGHTCLSVWVEKSTVWPMGCRKGGGEALLGGAPARPGAATASGTGWAAARGPVGACATVLNNLTFQTMADPTSQVGELAGRAVAGGHHELPLAVTVVQCRSHGLLEMCT